MIKILFIILTMSTIILIGIMFVFFQYLIEENGIDKKTRIYTNSIFLIITNVILSSRDTKNKFIPE